MLFKNKPDDSLTFQYTIFFVKHNIFFSRKAPCPPALDPPRRSRPISCADRFWEASWALPCHGCGPWPRLWPFPANRPEGPCARCVPWPRALCSGLQYSRRQLGLRCRIHSSAGKFMLEWGASTHAERVRQPIKETEGLTSV